MEELSEQQKGAIKKQQRQPKQLSPATRDAQRERERKKEDVGVKIK